MLNVKPNILARTRLNKIKNSSKYLRRTVGAVSRRGFSRSSPGPLPASSCGLCTQGAASGFPRRPVAGALHAGPPTSGPDRSSMVVAVRFIRPHGGVAGVPPGRLDYTGRPTTLVLAKRATTMMCLTDFLG